MNTMRVRPIATWWLNSRLNYYWWAPVRDWVLQIWFCHHNARVIIDFEHRMACVLTSCTRGMSKPYYTVQAMQTEIEDFLQCERDDAVREFKEDYECHCDESVTKHAPFTTDEAE